MVALIEEVANTVIFNSSKWIFDSGTCSYMTPARNDFKSFSSVQDNVVLADKTWVEYTGVGSVHLSCPLWRRDNSLILLCYVSRMFQV
jgi:hypothetical protein